MMKVGYKDPPIEDRMFALTAEEVSGSAHFTVYLNGQSFWEHECPDPPCHEQLRIPPNIAGSTLLVTVRDSEEEHELLFFINDNGEGVPEKPRVKQFAFR
jgi:hypothetical protein